MWPHGVIGPVTLLQPALFRHVTIPDSLQDRRSRCSNLETSLTIACILPLHRSHTTSGGWYRSLQPHQKGRRCLLEGLSATRGCRHVRPICARAGKTLQWSRLATPQPLLPVSILSNMLFGSDRRRSGVGWRTMGCLWPKLQMTKGPMPPAAASTLPPAIEASFIVLGAPTATNPTTSCRQCNGVSCPRGQGVTPIMYPC